MKKKNIAIPFRNKYSLYSGDFNKKKRQILTQYQADQLKMYFSTDPYPSTDKVDLIAKTINLDAKKIVNWFSHQRQQNKNLKKNLK